MIKEFLSFRKLMLTLAMNELHTRYFGTFVGFLWSVINPAMMAIIYWFIFSSIFYSGRVTYNGLSLPYICYFLSGYAPWLLFQESLTRSLNTIIDNPNYVKKIIFPVQILSPIQILVSSISHIIIITALIIIMLFSSISLDFGMLMIIPYYIALVIFTLGFAWLVSAINVFMRDTSQVVNIVLNIWFWLTPIVWAIEIMPERYHSIFMFNPFIFFVDGYRKSLFGHNYNETINDDLKFLYLLFTIIIYFVGKKVFQKLRHQFGDVL